MQATVRTVAFQGIDVLPVDVQVMISNGQLAFPIVGLPDKAVEALEAIKLFLEVEGCAFVLALDEEVVERGIAHRYRDYALQGKEGLTPITGAEYLARSLHANGTTHVFFIDAVLRRTFAEAASETNTAASSRGLAGFAQRYPKSTLALNAIVRSARLSLQIDDPGSALRLLDPTAEALAGPIAAMDRPAELVAAMQLRAEAALRLNQPAVAIQSLELSESWIRSVSPEAAYERLRHLITTFRPPHVSKWFPRRDPPLIFIFQRQTLDSINFGAVIFTRGSE